MSGFVLVTQHYFRKLAVIRQNTPDMAPGHRTRTWGQHKVAPAMSGSSGMSQTRQSRTFVRDVRDVRVSGFILLSQPYPGIPHADGTQPHQILGRSDERFLSRFLDTVGILS